MLNNLDAFTRRKALQVAGKAICTIFIAGCAPYASSKKAVDDENEHRPHIDVLMHPPILPVKQSTNNTCWAAVWTMMLSWSEGKQFTTEAAVNHLGPVWSQLFHENKGLMAQTSKEEGFLKASKLQAKPPANYLPSAYVELLASRGPLWINSGDGLLNHATILVGVCSGRDGRIIFQFVDPQQGAYVSKSDEQFFADFEREARFIVDNHLDWEMRYQIFHW